MTDPYQEKAQKLASDFQIKYGSLTEGSLSAMVDLSVHIALALREAYKDGGIEEAKNCAKHVEEAVEEEREACAKIAQEHGDAHSKQADKLEITPVEKFMDARTRSDMVVTFASISMEAYCIAKAIRSRNKESR